MHRILETRRDGGGFPSLWGLLAILLAVAGCAGNTAYEVRSPPGTTTTYILVRHAEKLDQEVDSPLSAAGRERAQALAEALAPMGVTAIYGTQVKRNLETAQPVADRLRLDVIALRKPGPFGTSQLADEFVRESLANHGGGIILWIGNSSDLGDWASNLQQIYRRLGGTGEGPRAYHDLYIMVVGDHGGVAITKQQYGRVVP